MQISETLKIGEKETYFDGRVEIVVNSKYPAGQGYAPKIVQETHYNVSFNSHRINLPESAFNELLRVLELEGKLYVVEPEETIKREKEPADNEPIKEVLENDLEENEKEPSIEAIRKEYEELYGAVPNNMKNNKDWLCKKIRAWGK